MIAITLLRRLRETRRHGCRAHRRRPSPAVESLNHRLLLSAGLGHAAASLIAEVGSHHHFEHDGTVVERPQFYEDYVGPKLAQLDVVAASGQLLRNGNFRFVGVNQGAINTNVLATYVFGVDRNGNLPTGPFPDRPNIRFDATVAIKIVPGKSPTVVVTDLANKTTTTLPDSMLQISGRSISVTVPESLLPSTGLTPSHYRYNFWPEDGLAGSTNIASYAPETHDIRVGVQH
jgi:hypothetical protein